MKKTSYLKVKDYSVSGDSFELIYNKTFDFLETQPQPSLDKLPDYYQSEDYISHTDSQRTLFEKAYQFVKKIAIKRKLKIIKSNAKEGKYLLDFGCGTGDFLKEAQKKGWTVFGVEPNEQARQIANKKTNNLVFNSDHISKFKKESFDVITLWHVLEHLPNTKEQLSVFNKLLKPNGILIVAVPNYKSYDARYYKNFWAAFDVPRHLWHFSRTAINNLVSIENMKVIKTYPMLFDAFYVSLLSEKYKSGKMKPLLSFLIGCFSNLRAISTKEYSSLIYCIKKEKI
ncbi:class I SAM-dependent methyltransferase [Gaetbulibacter aquiaggeris]|uniref:Class I SAM-dependent methyltransferase n=1 Tax=Gaetbulibacter aquiaggeris TaxID=1735373 RepID=A0ABW7MNC7_9FLAO